MRVMMQRKFTQTVQQQFLRAKDCVMKTATTVQENAEDILAEAQQINESRAAKEAEAVYEAEEAEETETQEENTGAQDFKEEEV